ncbi:MAG TPA: hypothetical protein VLH13_00370, partial [Methanomassiliicoccales archaeon]|nr:hypothetical protein [Methanomassiliicoccales archaeon]
MKFEPSQGAILNMGGILKESDTCAMPYEIVLGETDDGKAITMIGSNGVWLSHPYRTADDGEPDLPGCSYLNANVLLIGKHYQTSKDIVFEGFIINLSHLSDWAGCSSPGSSERFRAELLGHECDFGKF